MKGYLTQAISHPFQEDASQVLNDYNITKSMAALPFKVNADGYLYVWANGQSNMQGRAPYTNPDGFIENYTPTTEVPNGLGGWVVASFPDAVFLSKYYNISLLFCDMLTQKYGVKCRMILNAFGGTGIADWQLGGAPWQDLIDQITLLGSNFKPFGLWLFSQGENDWWRDSEYYTPLWEQLRTNALTADYLQANHNWICNEISTYLSSPNIINPTLKQIADSNSNYGMVRTDGLGKLDSPHWSPSGLRGIAQRMFTKFEQLTFGYDEPIWNVRPTVPTLTIGVITATTVDLSWVAATADTGLIIVSYVIYSKNGFTFYGKVNADVFTLTADLSLASGETEYFSVLAIDSNGNSTWWEPNILKDVLIP